MVQFSKEIHERLADLNRKWGKLSNFERALFPHVVCEAFGHLDCKRFHPQYELGEN